MTDGSTLNRKEMIKKEKKKEKKRIIERSGNG